MSVTPELIRQLLNSENLGDRLRGVNQLRLLDPAIAYKLIQTAFTDASARVRYAAVSQMSSLGNQNLAEALITLRDCLNDPEPDVQAAAADSLGALKLTQAFEDLQHLYQSTPEWLVKFSIVAALGELGDPRGFELLKEALNSGQDMVQAAAIGSLGDLGDRRAVALLAAHSLNDDW
ncbi:MAG TPA: HEAT repeat domain-containing protein, partial [Candidatus Caenarcaniphilales bacterium]